MRSYFYRIDIKKLAEQYAEEDTGLYLFTFIYLLLIIKIIMVIIIKTLSTNPRFLKYNQREITPIYNYFNSITFYDKTIKVNNLPLSHAII